MKTKQIEYEDFPQVWKNSELGLVAIVYQNRVEYYKFVSRYNTQTYRKATGEPDAKWNPFKEIDNLLKGNGFKRVHGMKTVKVIDFTR